jgi:hypothetical protein
MGLMPRPPPEPARCAVCDAPGARPAEGHRFPLCHECEQEWLRSGERARARTVRDDFVRRRRAERERPAAKMSSFHGGKEDMEDDPWSG